MTYLFWAYAVVWSMIAAYVVFLAVKLRRVGQRLDRLEREVSRGER